MSSLKYRQMAIIYGQGQELRFKFPIQTTEEDVTQRIEEVLKLPSVSISTGDALYVIPTSSILTIIVTPSPKKLPRTVIRGAALIGVGDT